MSAQLGVYNPMSTAEPTTSDLESSSQLEDLMRKLNMYETKQESQNRERVLGKLISLVREWIRVVSLKNVSGVALWFNFLISEQGLSEELAREAGGKIFTFGSYRLGVHDPGADIDTYQILVFRFRSFKLLS